VLQARSRQAFKKPFLDPAVKKHSQIPAVRENVYLSCNSCQVFESLFLILQFKKNAQIPAVRENVTLTVMLQVYAKVFRGRGWQHSQSSGAAALVGFEFSKN
jgi:hypothetical protein